MKVSEMMDLISVIVPVYKVEAYLDQCVQSIVDQTYTNLEIILVDDGSPDNCPAMCDAWAQKDSRVKVIHKENGGLSDARNAGLAIATGDYIGFVDSDDWLAIDFYKTLYQTMVACRADLTASGIIWAYEDRLEADRNTYTKRAYSAQEAMHTLIHGRGFYAVAWNKLYKAELLRNIIYPVGKLHEDEFVTHRLVGQAKRLVLCPEVAYYYRQRSMSIMSSWTSRHLDALDAHEQRVAYLQAHFPELYLEDKVTFLLSCAWHYRRCERIEDREVAQKRVCDHANRICFSTAEFLKLKPRSMLQVLRAKAIFMLAR